jgi:transcriptional regulator with XRE-family HTH domain
MELAEKLRRLRKAEGVRRGLWRTLTQHEVIRAMRQELGVSLSQAYLSQLENGRRAHLTSATREALARFYHVYPGYLMSDPPGSASAPLPPAPADATDAPASPDAELAALWARLSAAPEPARLARLLDWLLRLSPAELAALERRMEDTPPAEIGVRGAPPAPERADG